MNIKRKARLRRATRARFRMRSLGVTRLCVHRTLRHIYVQLIVLDSQSGDKVLTSASTLDSTLRDGKTGNIEAAANVGKLIAERAQMAGVTKVSFDRSGFKYHGRVKALAEAAREHGLQF